MQMDLIKEDGDGLENGDGNSSFGQILSMVSPESAMTVTEVGFLQQLLAKL